ncbi:MAG: hypothetical protein PHO77_06955 [Bacteroidales bacterium]|nr:hypothetical protein [Bacteroidales bacterium]
MQKQSLKKIVLSVSLSLCASVISLAQEVEQTPMEKTEAKVEEMITSLDELKKLKISGYVQGDVQVGQSDAKLKVGSAKNDHENAFVRMGIRRGRVKLSYTDNLRNIASNAVFQLDMTEKGVSIKDAFVSFTDPWIQWMSVKAGIFDRPFGNEISYSSSLRESPERSTGCLTLFPGERDLGAALIIQAPKGNPLNGLKLETGLFAGNGVNLDNDNRKDWISHLSYKHSFENIQFGFGASFYYGNVYQGNDTIFQMKGKEFLIKHLDGKDKYSQRMYYGADAQLLISTGLGMTNLRIEVIGGKQPGSANASSSPSSSTLPDGKTYCREFLSFVTYFIQDFGRHSLVLKYDQYDPNILLAANDIGLNGSSKGDIMKQNIGIGYLFRINANLRLMGYFDWALNETSVNLKGYEKDLQDNTFTCRLQYKF